MSANQIQHHDIVDALKAGQSARAQALLHEHSYKSRINLRDVLERVREGNVAIEVPGLRLVVG